MMVRIMIIALLIGSAFLGWRAWEQQSEINYYEDALKPNGLVEKTVESIQSRAYMYTQYKERSVNEGVKGAGDEDSISVYVRKHAQGDKVRWGGVKVGKAKESIVTVGKKSYKDTSYKMTPQEKDQTYDRHRIANLFYLLEKESRKVRVTDIDIKVAGKTLPHEIPSDAYDVDFTLTVRERSESKRR